MPGENNEGNQGQDNNNNNSSNAGSNNNNSNQNNNNAPSVKEAELQAKLDLANKSIQEYDKYYQDTRTVFDALESDPEAKEIVKKSVQKKLGGGDNKQNMNNNQDQNQNNNNNQNQNQNNGQNNNQPNPEVQNIRKDVDSLSATARNGIIESFYKDTGLVHLSEDKRRAVSQKIQAKLNQWGTGVEKADPAILAVLLKDAFTASGISDEDKAEIARSQQNMNGRIPNISGNSGGSGNGEEEIQLTEDQKKLAEMWGLDPERIKARVKEDRDGSRGAFGENTIGAPASK